MAITISGINNNDQIVASDGTIDSLSGFNVVGVMTAATFSGDLVGNVTGNVTGNVNNSTLLLQTGGSERFRITGNNELGIAGANYGTSGQVLTSGGSGSAVSWTTLTSGVTSDGSQNTVGGSNAGDSIVSGGTENTVFGYNAGTAISTGDNNTFFGSRSGRSVSGNVNNTGVGYNVMGNASGSGNAAVGRDAGNGMGVGINHVAIGYGAFSNTNQSGTQQNNIVIGYLADVSGSTVSNEMTLGNTNINHVRIPGIGVSFSEGGAAFSGIATFYAGATVNGNVNITDSIIHTGNTNTKIRFPADNEISMEINGNERFKLNSIGYATFSGALASFQGASFAQDVSIVDTIKHTGDTNTRIRFPANDTISFQTDASERLRITSDGKLGVGVASPVSILHLHEAGSSGAPIIQFSNGDTGTTTGDGFAIGMADNESPFIYNRENTDLRIATNNTERLRIKNDGKLGVGDFSSTSVAQQLHVRGSQPEIYLEHTGGYDLTLTTNDGAGQNGITVNGGYLSLAYNNKNIVMCRTGGKVGISTVLPVEKFEVNGSINAGGENNPVFQIRNETGSHIKAFKHYFDAAKGQIAGYTSNRTILNITIDESFHQAGFEITYFTRLQAVSDTHVRPNKIIFGVNRFNSANSVNVTKTVVEQHTDAANHCDVNVVSVSGTNYQIQIQFGTQPNVSSAAGGWIEGITNLGARFADIDYYYGTRR